ncbi:hypothetical protein AB4Z09_26300 [Rhodococcus sp. TAF43]|uniref:hypothetical protein n=1 Tax=Rhodococcus sp. TAF43 TaxID=3237483 RepID=UPI003F950583
MAATTHHPAIPETVTEYKTITVTATPTTTAPPTTTTQVPVVTTKAGLKTQFGGGVYVGGTDVAAGTYYSDGPTNPDVPMCAYTYLPYKGASLGEADGGNNSFGPTYMQLAEGQIVQTLGCNWVLES